MSDQRYKTAKIYISLKHGETIIKELHTQFKEGRNCDLEIRLNKKRLYVHKCLIDIFFIKAGAELEDDRFFLDLTGYSQPVVEALIGLIYTGNLRCSLDQVEMVYKAAVDLGCVEAQTGCQTYLRENGIPFVSSSGNPGNSRDSSSSPGVPHIPYSTKSADPALPQLEPDIIVKSEPVDDFNGSDNLGTVDSAKQADTGTGRYHYRSTYLVPVTGSNSASSLLSYKYSGNLAQKTQCSVSSGKLHTTVPAMQSFQSSSETYQSNIAYKQTGMSQYQRKNGSGKRKAGLPTKIVTKDLANKNVSSPDHSNADSNGSSQTELSADNDVDDRESQEKNMSEEHFGDVSTIVKIERDVDDVSAGTSSVEDNIDAQKKEQMFSLGLAKKTDIETNVGVNNSGKRRLRTRKKVDYNSINIERSDFDDSSDYDPLEDVKPKKKLKSQAASKGKNIDTSSLVTLNQSRETEKTQNEELVNISPTVAVRQDHLRNDFVHEGIESDERVYFPPAGSVPSGVNSQYAQGTFLKVKYVSETITDADGNVTVISRRVPVRPRQFGLDERLKNRPAVYVCHPTAPVVKPVIGKRRP